MDQIDQATNMMACKQIWFSIELVDFSDKSLVISMEEKDFTDTDADEFFSRSS